MTLSSFFHLFSLSSNSLSLRFTPSLTSASNSLHSLFTFVLKNSLTTPTNKQPKQQQTCKKTKKGIRAIKLYAWEGPYLERINALRELELAAIRRTQMLSLVGRW